MLRLAVKTDVGRKRDHNEDAWLALPEEGLFVIADGVGGRASGEVASALCIDTFRIAAEHLHAVVLNYGESHTAEARNAVLTALEEVCQLATRRIYDTAEIEGRRGMTTTLVCVLIGGGAAFLCHVGDSRAYLMRDGDIRQLTEDHSMVNELVRTGKMTYAEARASKHRHVITRAVGLYPTVQPSLAAFDMLPKDRILLCSDGLSDVVMPATMLELGAVEDIEGGVAGLVQAALDGGGPDNITVVLVDAEEGDVADEAVLRARMLESLFLFEDMPYAARLQVARVLEEHYFAPGDVLVAQDAVGRQMYVVLEGEVSVRREDVELARMGPGEHFGELALVDHLPRSASVVAATFGAAISISPEALESFILREPELGSALLWKLLRVLGYRLRQANARFSGTSV
jgi:serine/threonine protein phosphatase PrpC